MNKRKILDYLYDLKFEAQDKVSAISQKILNEQNSCNTSLDKQAKDFYTTQISILDQIITYVLDES